MLNPTSDSAPAPDSSQAIAAGSLETQSPPPQPLAPHPLQAADWAPVAALLDRSLADHGYPLPPGLADQIVADVAHRLASASLGS